MIRVGAVFATLLVFAAASTARANETAGARPGRALFERAEANFNRGKFEEARADYQAAYEVEPLPAFLFNIGQCYRNMGDYERAQFFFHRYTVLDPRSPNRGAAERLIAEMDRLADERRSHDSGVTMAANVSTPAPALAAQTDRSAGTSLLAPTVQTTAGPAPSPLYRRPWFWVAVGGTVALGAAVAIALSHDSPSGTLPSIDARDAR